MKSIFLDEYDKELPNERRTRSLIDNTFFGNFILLLINDTNCSDKQSELTFDNEKDNKKYSIVSCSDFDCSFIVLNCLQNSSKAASFFEAINESMIAFLF
jgi:hypothetical protein